jgi:aspartate racemase
LKTTGLIGGMSWESTIPYYRQINETIKEQLGGLHSAKIILYSVDFHEVYAAERTNIERVEDEPPTPPDAVRLR